jgi:hypothetical protein
MQIGKKKVVFGGFNNDKLKKEIINITKVLYLVPISSQKHVWMIRNVFSYMHYSQICLNVFIIITPFVKSILLTATSITSQHSIKRHWDSLSWFETNSFMPKWSS